jgi:predicted ATPase
MLVVQGEAGIGKHRLVDEVRREVAARSDDRCPT